MKTKNSQSNIKKYILAGVLILIVIIIVYLVYIYFGASEKIVSQDLSTYWSEQEDIAQVEFASEELKNPPFSELQSFGGQIDGAGVKTGRANPFVAY